jgi:predicted small metal-binding protein
LGLSFKCADIGMKCGFETKADNKEQLMKSIATHAKEAHNITTIAPDLMMKVTAAYDALSSPAILPLSHRITKTG